VRPRLETNDSSLANGRARPSVCHLHKPNTTGRRPATLLLHTPLLCACLPLCACRPPPVLEPESYHPWRARHMPALLLHENRGSAAAGDCAALRAPSHARPSQTATLGEQVHPATELSQDLPVLTAVSAPALRACLCSDDRTGMPATHGRRRRPRATSAAPPALLIAVQAFPWACVLTVTRTLPSGCSVDQLAQLQLPSRGWRPAPLIPRLDLACPQLLELR
jgi:hypothetical protein